MAVCLARLSLAPSVGRGCPLVVLIVLALLTIGLLGAAVSGAPRPGDVLRRTSDEMVVCGQLFHTGTPVVLWLDPGGYDAYRVERRFAPFEQSSWQQSHEAVNSLRSPNRFGLRKRSLTQEQLERVRGGGWDLPLLREVVDQFVIHYDACGTSRRCFQVLHDRRGLSVHFMLDVDGTVYQTLDLKERAWHATIANSRSVGVEIANIGAYPVGAPDPFSDWYRPDARGSVRLTIPASPYGNGVRTGGFVGRPIRNELIVGTVQGRQLRQYDLTPQQYEALIRLTASLCTVFPKLRCDYPRDAAGQLVPHKLPDEQLKVYPGMLGHLHVQSNKIDPGPAFQWDRLVEGARKLLQGSARP